MILITLEVKILGTILWRHLSHGERDITEQETVGLEVSTTDWYELHS